MGMNVDEQQISLNCGGVSASAKRELLIFRIFDIHLIHYCEDCTLRVRPARNRGGFFVYF